MITEAEIKEIDYTKNICKIYIPIFGNTADDTSGIVSNVHFMLQPGMTLGYAVGDLVWVAFDRNRIADPIVIGLVGSEKSGSGKSGIACDGLTVSGFLNINSEKTNIANPEHIGSVEPSFTTLAGLISYVNMLEQRIAALEKSSETTE